MADVKWEPTPMATGTSQEAGARREAKLDALHERLASAVSGLVTGEDWMRAVAFAARFRSRSFGNTLLIYAQHYHVHEQGRVPEPFPTPVGWWAALVGVPVAAMVGVFLWSMSTAVGCGRRGVL